jgi:hypothetical protein
MESHGFQESHEFRGSLYFFPWKGMYVQNSLDFPLEIWHPLPQIMSEHTSSSLASKDDHPHNNSKIKIMGSAAPA